MSLISEVEKLEQIKKDINGLIERAAIIFIDMTGSTTYKDERGIASGVGKVIKFNLDVTKIIKEKGEEFKQKGEIEEYEICKYIGDEVMAYFKGKDSSKVAVEIAIDIENHFKDVNSEISDEFEKYKPKIGIDFGEVLFAQYYENSPLDPHGLIVDRAARIVSLAKPCQILISEEATNDAGDKVDVEFSEKEKKKFKGIKEKTIVREGVWDEEIGELGIKLEEEPKQLEAEIPEQKDTTRETMPLLSHAQVSGTYYVKGKNPVNKIEYNGELQIKEKGELLEATWVIEPTKEGDAPKQSNGTGLCVDNALAFAFNYSDGRLGCILYEILSDDLMRGKWGLVDETNKDVEECFKKRA